MDIVKIFYKEITENKTSWIQTLNKEQIIIILQKAEQSISTDSSLDDLRKLLRTIVSSGKLLSLMTSQTDRKVKVSNMNSKIEPFNGSGDFELFEQQIECVIALDDISTQKQPALLLTHLAPKVLEILNHLCSPENPLKKSYQDLIQLLKDRYTKSTTTQLDRSIFRNRNQKQNETVEEYIVELKKLAKRCNFKDINDQVKEKFIDGVSQPIIKFELLKNGDQSLDKILLLARTVETAMTQSKVDTGSTESGSKDMFQIKKLKTSTSRPQPKTYNGPKKVTYQKHKKYCSVCGKNNHEKYECRLKNKYCSECGKQGHIFRMCNIRHTKTVDIVNDSDIESDIKNLFVSDDSAHSYSMYTNTVNTNKVPPQLLDVIIEGKCFKFELDTGSEVAVCGRSGSGKSTLLLSCAGATTIGSGRILIDGHDVTRIPLRTLRHRVVVLPQEPVMFSGTLRENLDPLAVHTDEEIWQSLRAVGLYDFVHAQPAGLECAVGRHGGAGGSRCGWSGGRSARACAARAALRAPLAAALLLDEPAAALDAAAERALLAALRGPTLLTVAHRVSSVADYDAAVVLEEGRVAERGSLRALLAAPASRLARMAHLANTHLA